MSAATTAGAALSVTTQAGRVALSQAVRGFWSLAPRTGVAPYGGKVDRPRVKDGEDAAWTIVAGQVRYSIFDVATGEILREYADDTRERVEVAP